MTNKYAISQGFPPKKYDLTNLGRIVDNSRVGLLAASEVLALRHFGLLADLDIKQHSIGWAKLAEREVLLGWRWHDNLMFGLQILLLYGDAEQISSTISRFHLELDPGATVPLEKEVPQIHLLICNELKDSKSDGSFLLAKILKCRKKRPVLAAKAFRAAVHGTQDEYDVALVAGLSYYRTLESEFRGYCAAHLHTCNELSCVNLLAQRLGKKTPDLPDELAACLLTKESVENPVV